jgi:hypothetical protein
MHKRRICHIVPAGEIPLPAAAKAAAENSGRGKGVDAFSDAHLKLVAASGRGSWANHLGRACEQPALWAQELYHG